MQRRRIRWSPSHKTDLSDLENQRIGWLMYPEQDSKIHTKKEKNGVWSLMYSGLNFPFVADQISDLHNFVAKQHISGEPCPFTLVYISVERWNPRTKSCVWTRSFKILAWRQIFLVFFSSPPTTIKINKKTSRNRKCKTTTDTTILNCIRYEIYFIDVKRWITCNTLTDTCSSCFANVLPKKRNFLAFMRVSPSQITLCLLQLVVERWTIDG